MRFASLGSGSRGNGTLIEEGGTSLLLDCGFTLRETERRLARLGKHPDDLDGILVTHEHSDHVGGVGPLARKYKVPVWMTPGTFASARLGEVPNVRLFNSHDVFAIGDLQIQPFPVPHDAREPSQFVFGNGAVRLGVLTDVGSITPHIRSQLQGCDALLIESNHDSQMLANGSYPPMLKARVGGRLGHLSNDQTADVLANIDCSRLQHLVAAHLSEKNNTPALVQVALSEALGCGEGWIAIADQDEGFDWRAVA